MFCCRGDTAPFRTVKMSDTNTDLANKLSLSPEEYRSVGQIRSITYIKSENT